MIDLLLFPVGVLVLFLVLGKARRVERALWAMVSQLQAMRREEHDDIDPAATRRAREAAASGGKISLSMFGR